jgi:hypothetical protein
VVGKCFLVAELSQALFSYVRDKVARVERWIRCCVQVKIKKIDAFTADDYLFGIKIAMCQSKLTASKILSQTQAGFHHAVETKSPLRHGRCQSRQSTLQDYQFIMYCVTSVRLDTCSLKFMNAGSDHSTQPGISRKA